MARYSEHGVEIGKGRCGMTTPKTELKPYPDYIALEQSRKIDFELGMIQVKHFRDIGDFERADHAEYEALRNKCLEVFYSTPAEVQRELNRRTSDEQVKTS